MDVANLLVVNAVEEFVIEIFGCALKLVYPEFEVRDHFPFAPPLFSKNPPWWALKIQTNKKLISFLIIIRDLMRFKQKRFKQNLLKCISSMSFYIHSVTKIPRHSILALLHHTNKLLQLQPSLKLFLITSNKRMSIRILSISQLITNTWLLWHQMSINPRYLNQVKCLMIPLYKKIEVLERILLT